MEDISEITKLIISNFNKPIDKKESEMNYETELKYIELYQKYLKNKEIRLKIIELEQKISNLHSELIK